MKHLASIVAMLAGAACGKPAAAPQAPPSDDPGPTPELAPAAVRTLIADGAPSTGGTWARLYGYDRAWLRPDGEPVGAERDAIGWAEIVAVAEVRGDKIRVLHDEDDARVLVWIPTEDLSNALVARTGVALDPTAPLPTGDGPGVVAEAGSRVEVRDPVGDRTGITIRDEGLDLDGFVPTAAIGTVWERVPPPARARTHEIDDTAIRAAPAADARAVATARGVAYVRALAGPTAGWTEVESIGPFVTARGFVPEATLTPVDPQAEESFLDSGSVYSVSETVEVALAAGACLYDQIGGAPIGQNLVARVRRGSASEQPGWWTVIADSPWGLLELAVHRDDGDGWTRCDRWPVVTSSTPP